MLPAPDAITRYHVDPALTGARDLDSRYAAQ